MAKGFSWKEKHDHYTNVANGSEPVKENSKFSEAEQKAYARGQRDARNEANRITAYNNSTQADREQYAAKRAVEREKWKSEQGKQPKKNGK